MTPPSTTSTMVRMKLRLIRNSTRTTQGTIGLVLSGLLGTVVAVGGFATFALAGHGQRAMQDRTMIGGACIFFVAWVFLPVLSGGLDESVDPGRLSLIPLTATELRRGLLAAACTAVLPASGAIALCGVLVGFARVGPSILVVLAATIMIFVLALVCSRAMATALAGALRSRRGRDIAVVVSAVLGTGLWLGAQLLGSVTSLALDRLVDVMRWTPPGWLGQAVLDGHRGHLWAGTARVIAAAIVAMALARWWIAAVDRLAAEPEAQFIGRRADRHSSDHVLIGRLHHVLPAGPISASIAKELLYSWRSPTRRTATLTGTVMGVGFALLQIIRSGTDRASAVWGAPIAIAFMALNTFNQLGHDGPSFWLEALAAPRGVTRLIGRNVAWMVAMAFPLTVATIILGLIAGEWSPAPVAWCAGVAMIFIAQGVGCLSSILLPIPIPDGSNPFSRRQPEGNGCAIGAIALGSMGVLALLIVPVLIAMRWASGNGPDAIVALANMTYGVAVWVTGLRWGSRLLERRLPEMVSMLGAKAAVA